MKGSQLRELGETAYADRGKSIAFELARRARLLGDATLARTRICMSSTRIVQMLNLIAERCDEELLSRGEAPSFAPVGDGPDFCSRDGAHALKQRIELYWRERGCNVHVLLHNVGFHPAIRAARYDVRSDMVNGMPRPRAKASGQPGAGNDDASE